MATLYYSSDMALEETGTLLVLSSRAAGASGFSLTRCNKWGAPIEEVILTDTPSEFDDFIPDAVSCANNQIFLVDRSGMKAVVADQGGRFEAGYFITADGPGEVVDSSIETFCVEADGTLSFTLTCRSEPVIISIGGDENRSLSCFRTQHADGLTLGVIAFIGLFVSCYLIR